MAAATGTTDGPKNEKEVFDHEAYSGLQVVGDGRPQIVSREAPEVVAPGGLPEYAEHKAFGQYPPPQVSPQQQYNGAAAAYQYPAQQQPGGGSPYSMGGAPPPGTDRGPGMAADYHYNNGGNPFEPPGAKIRHARICGLRRKVFWVVLALVVFGLMVAIAVGLGLGLGEQNNSKSSSSASSSSNATATTTSATTSTALPAATATATATGNTDIICPTANQTLYTLATETSKKFLVLCGRDYNSDGGATDLTSMNITTFEGCLTECGNLDGCIAVGWGNYYGTNTCWLKSGIGTPNHSQNWYAAVEDDSG